MRASAEKNWGMVPIPIQDHCGNVKATFLHETFRYTQDPKAGCPRTIRRIVFSLARSGADDRLEFSPIPALWASAEKACGTSLRTMVRAPGTPDTARTTPIAGSLAWARAGFI